MELMYFKLPLQNPGTWGRINLGKRKRFQIPPQGTDEFPGSSSKSKKLQLITVQFSLVTLYVKQWASCQAKRDPHYLSGIYVKPYNQGCDKKVMHLCRKGKTKNQECMGEPSHWNWPQEGVKTCPFPRKKGSAPGDVHIK